jgi:hypothetical protein
LEIQKQFNTFDVRNDNVFTTVNLSNFFVRRKTLSGPVDSGSQCLNPDPDFKKGLDLVPDSVNLDPQHSRENGILGGGR